MLNEKKRIWNCALVRHQATRCSVLAVKRPGGLRVHLLYSTRAPHSVPYRSKLGVLCTWYSSSRTSRNLRVRKFPNSELRTAGPSERRAAAIPLEFDVTFPSFPVLRCVERNMRSGIAGTVPRCLCSALSGPSPGVSLLLRNLPIQTNRKTPRLKADTCSPPAPSQRINEAS